MIENHVDGFVRRREGWPVRKCGRGAAQLRVMRPIPHARHAAGGHTFHDRLVRPFAEAARKEMTDPGEPGREVGTKAGDGDVVFQMLKSLAIPSDIISDVPRSHLKSIIQWEVVANEEEAVPFVDAP